MNIIQIQTNKLYSIHELYIKKLIPSRKRGYTASHTTILKLVKSGDLKAQQKDSEFYTSYWIRGQDIAEYIESKYPQIAFTCR